MGKKLEESEVERRVLAMRDKTYEGIKILEMGAITHKEPEPRIPARQWYLERGAKKVLSIDLNGENGAIPHDLDTPLPEDLSGKFDLVTNYGTGEHVNDQYMFFKNCHDASKNGGVMVHQLNHPGFLPNHGRYYYSQETAFRIARLCAYSILVMENYSSVKAGREGIILVAYLKRSASTFPTPLQFKRAKIVDSGDTRRTGDYNKAGFGKLPKD